MNISPEAERVRESLKLLVGETYTVHLPTCPQINHESRVGYEIKVKSTGSQRGVDNVANVAVELVIPIFKITRSFNGCYHKAIDCKNDGRSIVVYMKQIPMFHVYIPSQVKIRDIGKSVCLIVDLVDFKYC